MRSSPTVLFDDTYELLHDRIHIKGVNPITEREYCVGGCTALLDAIGKTINKIGAVQKNTNEEERAEKVLFIITTDGLENASKEFNSEKVKQMVEHQKTKYAWEFIFPWGANIDAIAAAARVGISKDRAVNYCPDSLGTKLTIRRRSPRRIKLPRRRRSGGKLEGRSGAGLSVKGQQTVIDGTT